MRGRILQENKETNVNWNDDVHGRTALHWASLLGYHKIVTLLLAHPNIDVNPRCVYGSTPFMMTSRNGMTRCIQLLLQDPKVKPNLPDSDGSSPLWYAAREGHVEVIKRWIASGREMDLGELGKEKIDAIDAAKNPKRAWLEGEEKFAMRKRNCPRVVSLLERFRDRRGIR